VKRQMSSYQCFIKEQKDMLKTIGIDPVMKFIVQGGGKAWKQFSHQ